MADPQNVFALDDVAFITGCEVQPVVTTEKGIDKAIYLAYRRGAPAEGDLQLHPSQPRSRDHGVPGVSPVRAPSRPGRVSGGHGGAPATAIPIPQPPTNLAVGGGLLPPPSDPAKSQFADIEAELAGVPFPAAPKSDAEAADEAPIVRLVNQIIDQAIEQNATDIHIEPDETFFRVRYRIDGLMREVMNRPIELHAPTTSRIKILAEMDISEKRLPQDGRIQIRDSKRDVDLRASSVPTIFGEKLVLRILDKRRTIAKLDNIGFAPEDLARFREAISRPHGIILVTGPTGSGKTTTLMAALRELNSTERNILTLEDPVEYQIPGISQVQINERAGLTFARGLRAFVRQDPD
ncbi:MAG: Flp pilus assembly complex ATPase component TadA, partial [Firmicutes bacterium]|nr:Flp pilus assembly complex ATPase component TadA [Bacillota bacterium]